MPHVLINLSLHLHMSIGNDSLMHEGLQRRLASLLGHKRVNTSRSKMPDNSIFSAYVQETYLDL